MGKGHHARPGGSGTLKDTGVVFTVAEDDILWRYKGRDGPEIGAEAAYKDNRPFFPTNEAKRSSSIS